MLYLKRRRIYVIEPLGSGQRVGQRLMSMEWKKPELVYKVVEEVQSVSLPKGGLLEAIKEGRIPKKELLRRGRNDTTIVSLRISRTLKEALLELVNLLNELGYGFHSLNDFIVRLLAEIVLAACGFEYKEEEKPTLIININLSSNSRCSALHSALHGVIHAPDNNNIGKVETPEGLKTLLKNVIRALQKCKYLDKEAKIEVLEPLLEKLQQYRDYPLAQHFISAIEYELSR